MKNWEKIGEKSENRNRSENREWENPENQKDIWKAN